MQNDPKTPSRTTATDGNVKSSPMADKPCRYFISDGGCKAGKSCKWLHSWDGVTDKSSRCWICGAKDHRKSECKVKAASRKPGEPAGSGGGTGQGRGGSSNDVPTSTTTAASSTAGGKAGAAAAKVLQNTDKMSTTSILSTSASPAEVKNAGGPSEEGVNSGDGGTGGDPKGTKADELLHEATQLLKSLRVQPKVNVMQLAGLEQAENDWVLIDSGATHALRPAHEST